MNKLLVFFSLFLVASMCFVTIPNTAQADSQLDILVKITQNTKEHIINDIVNWTIFHKKFMISMMMVQEKQFCYPKL